MNLSIWNNFKSQFWRQFLSTFPGFLLSVHKIHLNNQSIAVKTQITGRWHCTQPTDCSVTGIKLWLRRFWRRKCINKNNTRMIWAQNIWVNEQVYYNLIINYILFTWKRKNKQNVQPSICWIKRSVHCKPQKKQISRIIVYGRTCWWLLVQYHHHHHNHD